MQMISHLFVSILRQFALTISSMGILNARDTSSLVMAFLKFHGCQLCVEYKYHLQFER
jgi:hypothetical protein